MAQNGGIGNAGCHSLTNFKYIDVWNKTNQLQIWLSMSFVYIQEDNNFVNVIILPNVVS